MNNINHSIGVTVTTLKVYTDEDCAQEGKSIKAIFPDIDSLDSLYIAFHRDEDDGQEWRDDDRKEEEE